MMTTDLTFAPGAELAKAAFSERAQNVNPCYQCGKCAVGWPVSYAADYTPAQLICGVRLGVDDLLLNSKTTWLCASCETCTTRCPQDVDVAMAMHAVKIMARHQGIKPAVRKSLRLRLTKIVDTWRCSGGLGVFHFVEQGTLAY